MVQGNIIQDGMIVTGMQYIPDLKWIENVAKNMDSIVEIGCWTGSSTFSFLSNCKGSVYAVDHWQGSGGAGKNMTQMEADVVYETFLANVGHFPNLKIMKMPSNEAVKYFNDKSIDMVFIDGSHEYKDVLEDITIWMPKAIKMICGHDYHFPPVKKAVDELLGTGNYKVTETGLIWHKEIE